MPGSGCRCPEHPSTIQKQTAWMEPHTSDTACPTCGNRENKTTNVRSGRMQTMAPQGSTEGIRQVTKY